MKRIVCITTMRDKNGQKANGVRVAEALAGLGHSVGIASRDQALHGPSLAGADLILAFGTLVGDERKRPGLFAKIRGLTNAAFALWYFDLCNPGMKNSPWKYQVMKSIVPSLDWLIMTDHSYPWEARAKNFKHLMQGVDPEEFAKEPESHLGRARDLIFTGGTRYPFQDRETALVGLRKRFSVAVFGRDAGRKIFGDLFWREHQRSRVVFVPKPPATAPKLYWSNRIYLATATGTPVVAGWTEGLESHFQDGRDVLFYTNQGELESAIAMLIEDPGSRIQVGRAGRARTLKDHTYSKRAQELMATIFPK